MIKYILENCSFEDGMVNILVNRKRAGVINFEVDNRSLHLQELK